MSTAIRLISRFKAQLASQVVSMGAGVLLMILLARLLTPIRYGLLSYAIAVFGVLGVLSKLGIAKSCSRYIAEYKEKDPEQIPHILRTSLGLNLLAIGAVAVGLVVGHRHLARLLDEPEMASLLLIGALFVSFDALKSYVQLILQGFEKIHQAAIINAVDSGSRLVFAVGFVALGLNASGALVGYVLGFTFATLLGFWVIYRQFYSGVSSADTIEDGLRRRIGEYAVPLTATNTANTLDKRVDIILVGIFINPVAVTYYTISKQIVQFVQTPISALGFTLSPTFGAKKADGNIEQAARIYEEAVTHSLLLYIPAAAGIVLVAEPAVQLVFGDQYSGAVPVLQVLAPFAILQSVTKVTSNGLDFLGRAKDRAVVKGVTAVLNVGLNILLIPMIGVIGAAIATVLTYFLYTASNVYIIHSEFNLRTRLLAGKIAHIVAVTAVMATTVSVVVARADGWVSLVAVITLGVVVWGVLSVITGLLDLKQIASVL